MCAFPLRSCSVTFGRDLGCVEPFGQSVLLFYFVDAQRVAHKNAHMYTPCDEELQGVSQLVSPLRHPFSQTYVDELG